jgi:hypothetical protein
MIRKKILEKCVICEKKVTNNILTNEGYYLCGADCEIRYNKSMKLLKQFKGKNWNSPEEKDLAFGELVTKFANILDPKYPIKEVNCIDCGKKYQEKVLRGEVSKFIFRCKDCSGHGIQMFGRKK